MTEPASASPVREVRWVRRTAVADIQGDVDLSRSVEFQQKLLLLLDERPQRLVVNLTAVPYMDSSGVASLVKVLSRARKAGTALTLVGMSSRVKSLFQITRLDSVFQIMATVEEAVS